MKADESIAGVMRRARAPEKEGGRHEIQDGLLRERPGICA